MKIKEIKVLGLYGLYNYDIPFNFINDERIRIIHAPNGFGKTTLLKLIDNVINMRLYEIAAIPFLEFNIFFDNGTVVGIIRNTLQNDITNDELPKEDLHNFYRNNKVEDLPFAYKIVKDGKTKKFDFNSVIRSTAISEGRVPINMIEKYLPNMERIAARMWMDRKTGVRFTYDEIINAYGSKFYASSELDSILKEIQELIPIHFISANRLMKSEPIMNEYRYENGLPKKENYIPSVVVYSKELANKLENVLAKSGTLSQGLDRTFPTRLMDIMTNSQSIELMTKENISNELKKLEQKRRRLEEVGLLNLSNEAAVQPTDAIDEQTMKVLSLYIKDTKVKLDIFNDIEKKINLMREIINKRFVNKEMKISRTNGFIFEMQNGRVITPELLSSGEQNEIVLIYELLFESASNALILIDEPEISLHVGWQQEFLSDMLNVSKLTGNSILIATHSPDIINGRWDLTIGLEDCENASVY